MEEAQKYIEAIIENNPSAVQQKLVAQGVMHEDYGYIDTDELKDTIAVQLSFYDEEQGIVFLSEVLDVSITNGPHQSYLQQMYSEDSVEKIKQYRNSYVGSAYGLIEVLIIIATLLLIIYLIRKM